MAKFSLTPEQYDVLFQSQNGKCAICEERPFFKGWAGGDQLCVDHDHVTGRIRGLLCNNCNRILGLLRDSPTLIKQFLEYLGEA